MGSGLTCFLALVGPRGGFLAVQELGRLQYRPHRQAYTAAQQIRRMKIVVYFCAWKGRLNKCHHSCRSRLACSVSQVIGSEASL